MRRVITVALAVAFAAAAHADTLTFPDGSTMDGTVKEVNDHCFDFVVNGTAIRFQREEISAIEKNAKVPSPEKTAVVPMVEKWERDMDAQSGMNADQREKAVVLIGALVRAQDPIERKKIVNELVALNKEVNLVRFFHTGYDDLPVSPKMERLAGLLAIQPDASMPLLEQGLTIPFAPMRLLCIVSYSSIEEEKKQFTKEAVECFARGAIDPDAEVQIASVYALAASKDKTATPVLLKALESPDKRLENVADLALAGLWGVKPSEGAAPQERVAFWQEQWKTNGPSIKNAIAMETLKPFVDKDLPTIVAHH